ncbi:hypothetical protein ACQKOE_10055 [Novosphingobium sp. NPDC080210]|uniref:hypothetical protein n=1 Tax=Novosphingobium sp. NPDC080210 TaxID=3390596 RepID=UPI003CFFA00C
MTDEAKALVERSETIRSQMYLDLVANDTQHKEMLGLIETQVREIERLREALKAERLKPCRHTRTTRSETQRPDLIEWQKAQSEWFDPTILEIVSEYAAFRDRAALAGDSHV